MQYSILLEFLLFSWCLKPAFTACSEDPSLSVSRTLLPQFLPKLANSTHLIEAQQAALQYETDRANPESCWSSCVREKESLVEKSKESYFNSKLANCHKFIYRTWGKIRTMADCLSTQESSNSQDMGCSEEALQCTSCVKCAEHTPPALLQLAKKQLQHIWQDLDTQTEEYISPDLMHTFAQIWMRLESPENSAACTASPEQCKDFAHKVMVGTLLSKTSPGEPSLVQTDACMQETAASEDALEQKGRRAAIDPDFLQSFTQLVLKALLTLWLSYEPVSATATELKKSVLGLICGHSMLYMDPNCVKQVTDNAVSNEMRSEVENKLARALPLAGGIRESIETGDPSIAVTVTIVNEGNETVLEEDPAF